MHRGVTTPDTGSTHNEFMNTVNTSKMTVARRKHISLSPASGDSIYGDEYDRDVATAAGVGVKLRVTLLDKCYLRQQLRFVARGTPLGTFANCSVRSTA